MKIKMVVDMRLSSNRKIDVNSVFEARKTPGSLLPMIAPYQIIEGPFSGIQIPVTHCVELQEEPTYSLAEYTEVHQELLQRREEVKDFTAYKERMEASLHVNALNQLERCKKEIGRLQDEVDEAREGKKVTLPREVAEAIEHYKAHGFLSLYGIGKAILTESNVKAVNARRILKERFEDHRDVLMTALVNGYTIEETVQTPKQKAIQYCIKHGLVARGHSEHDVVSAIMSILGTEQSG